jgi:hypothetical protein
MTINIVACGETASQYPGHGMSIGLNDSFKYGHQPNILGVFNHRSKFTQDRLNTIIKTKPVKFYADSDSWEKYFPAMIKVKLRSWDGHLYKTPDRLAHAHTSPFIGMSLAYNLGASKIVLWGCDFINHHTWVRSNSQMIIELRQYRQFVDALRREGVKTYLGAHGSLLEEFLTIATNEDVHING